MAYKKTTKQKSSIVSARDAGVVRNAPMPSWMAKDIAKLTPTSVPQTETDGRTSFEKKYNIKDGIAHITPDKFSDLLRTPGDIVKLSAQNIPIVEIDNGDGVSAHFEFYDNEKTDVTDWPLEHIVHSSTIIKQGISATYTKQSASIIYNEKKVYGTLREGEITPELLAHVRLGITNQSVKTAPKKFMSAEASANAALINSDFLRLVLKKMEIEGTKNLPFIFSRQSNGIDVNLGAISAPPQEITSLPLVTLSVIKTFIGSRGSKFPERMLSDIFQGHASVLICSDPPQFEPIALLKHPGLDNPDLTP